MDETCVERYTKNIFNASKRTQHEQMEDEDSKNVDLKQLKQGYDDNGCHICLDICKYALPCRMTAWNMKAVAYFLRLP